MLNFSSLTIDYNFGAFRGFFRNLTKKCENSYFRYLQILQIFCGQSQSSETSFYCILQIKNMDTHIYNIQIRVLICKEEGEFVARALELDLLGYGKTEAEAVQELQQTVEAQISFAHQMKDPGLIGFPADAEYFTRWEDAQRKVLHSQVLGDKSVKLEAKAVVITITPNEIKALRSRTFSKSEPVCA
jgi:hypothetical protein